MIGGSGNRLAKIARTKSSPDKAQRRIPVSALVSLANFGDHSV
jgi:hypothetical protein